MAQVLRTYDLPDMRKKRSSRQLAQETFDKNKSKIMEGYNRAISSAFGNIPSPVDLLTAEIDRQFEKDPKITQKQALIKALNARVFSTREEVYARNTIDMLKRTGKYDELRKLAGWTKGVKLEDFELDDNIGYLVYGGRWVIYHEEDYFAEDGLTIMAIEDYMANNWG